MLLLLQQLWPMIVVCLSLLLGQGYGMPGGYVIFDPSSLPFFHT
jgi:hypothetical protein